MRRDEICTISIRFALILNLEKGTTYAKPLTTRTFVLSLISITVPQASLFVHGWLRNRQPCRGQACSARAILHSATIWAFAEENIVWRDHQSRLCNLLLVLRGGLDTDSMPCFIQDDRIATRTVTVHSVEGAVFAWDRREDHTVLQ